MENPFPPAREEKVHKETQTDVGENSEDFQIKKCLEALEKNKHLNRVDISFKSSLSPKVVSLLEDQDYTVRYTTSYNNKQFTTFLHIFKPVGKEPGMESFFTSFSGGDKHVEELMKSLAGSFLGTKF